MKIVHHWVGGHCPAIAYYHRYQHTYTPQSDGSLLTLPSHLNRVSVCREQGPLKHELIRSFEGYMFRHSSFYPDLLRYHWHIMLYKLKAYNVLIGILIYCEMITTTALSNTCIISHNYHFFFVLRTFKIYSPCNFPVYNTVLVTIVTMLDTEFQNAFMF